MKNSIFSIQSRLKNVAAKESKTFLKKMNMPFIDFPTIMNMIIERLQPIYNGLKE